MVINQKLQPNIVESIVKLMNCLCAYCIIICAHIEDKLYTQNEGLLVGSPVSPLLVQFFINSENKTFSSNVLDHVIFLYKLLGN